MRIRWLFVSAMYSLPAAAEIPAGSLGDFVDMHENPDKRLSIVAIAPLDLARALSAAGPCGAAAR